ncbi:MAG: hypothetical protein Q8S84_04515 [bacterium]|nr:hypothetical protein [bacterium]
MNAVANSSILVNISFDHAHILPFSLLISVFHDNSHITGHNSSHLLYNISSIISGTSIIADIQ